jgi:hypothetical protein
MSTLSAGCQVGQTVTVPLAPHSAHDLLTYLILKKSTAKFLKAPTERKGHEVNITQTYITRNVHLGNHSVT